MFRQVVHFIYKTNTLSIFGVYFHVIYLSFFFITSILFYYRYHFIAVEFSSPKNVLVHVIFRSHFFSTSQGATASHERKTKCGFFLNKTPATDGRGMTYEGLGLSIDPLKLPQPYSDHVVFTAILILYWYRFLSCAREPAVR